MVTMETWYVLSIVALLLLGTQRFLYKVAAERKCITVQTTFFFMSTVTLLSTAAFFISNGTVETLSGLLIPSLFNSAAFLVSTIAHIEALRFLAASIVYPLIRLDIVLVVLFSVFFFKDHLSIINLAGILMALMVMIILALEGRKKEKDSSSIRAGFVCIVLAVLGGAVASISSKFAALHTNTLAFMALSYLIAAISSLGLKKSVQPGSGPMRDSILVGLAMGLLNFGGFYAFLQALAYGPLSLIASITGMHFVIAIILSVILYHERLTPGRASAIVLTIASIIFLGK